MQKQITPAALALSALLLTACTAAPVESVATVETAPEPAPQVLTAYAADGLAPALQAYADAQGVALNWTDDASTASLLALDHQPDGTPLDVTSDPLLTAAAARANITGSAASLPAGRSLPCRMPAGTSGATLWRPYRTGWPSRKPPPSP